MQLRSCIRDNVLDPDRIFLLLDQFSAHINEDVLDAAQDLNIELIYVPAGLTSELQPLDVGINSIIKSEHAKRFRESLFENNNRPYKPENALSDLVSITANLAKPVVKAAWDKMVASAKKRLAQLNSKSQSCTSETLSLPSAFEEDCELHLDS